MPPATSTIVRTAAVLLGSLAAACGNNYVTDIDGAWIPACDQTIVPEDGPTVVILPATHEEDVALPHAPAVRIAADGQVSWRRVKAVRDRLIAAGARPVLLVGGHGDIHALALEDKLHDGKHLHLAATNDGKFCLGHPDSDQLYCVKGSDEHNISAAFIREAMRKAIGEYKLYDVEVTVDPAMGWTNVVRALDGVRTCCYETAVRASLVQ
ncbi:MAG: hypothetical protein K8W52_05740 [Deltaproteobacteria bacterium]|nr:hypothetical protein [Deltaproteobacteria bacterium]